MTTNSHIEQEHPDYTAKARMWRRYRDLYAGGEQFRENAAEYLLRRQKEPVEVYQERLRACLLRELSGLDRGLVYRDIGQAGAGIGI